MKIDVEQIDLQSNEMLSVLDEIPLLICIFVPGGQVKYVNVPYCDFFDCDRSDLIGASFFDLIPEFDWGLDEQDVREIKHNGGQLVHEHSFTTEDGNERYQRWTIKLQRDSNAEVQYYYAIGEDTTEKRELEKDLENKEQEYEAANQQLDAQNQQLEAQNQQLDAYVQQLEAQEQQLRAEVKQKKEAQQRLDFAQKTADMGVWEWDLETDEVVWTQAMEALFEMESGEFDGEFETFLQFVEEKDRGKISETADLVFEEGGPQTCEYRVHLPEKGQRWLESRFDLVNENRLVGSSIDITERKETELEQRKLLTGWETTDLGLIVTDMESNVESTNPAVREMLGYSAEEFKQKNVEELSPEEDKREEVVRSIKAKGSWQGEILHQRKDGSSVPVELSTSIITDHTGETVGMLGVLRDLTERKERERELDSLNQQLDAQNQQLEAQNQQLDAYVQQLEAQEQQLRAEVDKRQEVQERLRLAAESADIGLWEWRLEEDKPTWTKRVKELYGFDPEEVEDWYEEFSKRINESNRERVNKEIEKALKAGDPYHQIYSYEHPERGEIWIEARGQVFTDENGEPVRMLGSVLDVTEQKELERDLRKANRELDAQNQQLDAYNQQLAAANQQLKATEQQLRAEIDERREAEEKLKRALSEKETLLQEVHHRVKNNLQVISSLLNLQKYEIEDIASPEVIEAFESSRRRVLSMSEVHNQIYQTKHLASVEPQSYVKNLTGAIVKSLEISRSPELEYEIDPDLELDVDDAIHCGLILNELISNALEHASEDPEEKLKISIEMFRDNDEYCFRVADTGCGLDPDFEISDSASLGLRLVHSLAEVQLDGELNIEVNDGTEFEIYFPAQN